MSPKQQPPRAAGSYGMASVLRHPWHIFKLPPPAASHADLAAVRGGEVRRVACWLRGSYAPFPSRLRQGWLDLSNYDAQWKPVLNRRQPVLHLTGPVESVRTRRAERRPQLCAGLTFQTPSGSIDLLVAKSDVPLVVGYFSPADQPASQPSDPTW
jgi:hypothetical protein